MLCELSLVTAVFAGNFAFYFNQSINYLELYILCESEDNTNYLQLINFSVSNQML